MISNKQKILDIKKWQDSQQHNKDMCGTYEFCCVCDKLKENPCDISSTKFYKMNKTRRAKAKEQFNIEGKKVEFRATIVDK